MCRSIRVSPSELIRQQQEILARNGENQRKRDQASRLEQTVSFLRQEVDAMKGQLCKERGGTCRGREFPADGPKSTRRLPQDESTEELERSIAGVEETNRKIRANLDKERQRG